MVNLGSDDLLYNVLDSILSRSGTFYDQAAAGIELELFLTDFPPALFEIFTSEIGFVDRSRKGYTLPVEEVYDSLHHTLYLSSITCAAPVTWHGIRAFGVILGIRLLSVSSTAPVYQDGLLLSKIWRVLCGRDRGNGLSPDNYWTGMSSMDHSN
ncbi:hypothetical protein V1507DRAFT_443909 [Lipomyces tetrasporus]